MTTNSIGIRGPEVDRKKPPGVTRIVMLGGSSVFGYYVNDGQEAARQLERLLREQAHQVEVINGGVPGYNLFQTISRFQEKLESLQPDIVILYLGWNDLPYICSQRPDEYRRRPIASAAERLLGHSALYGFVGYRLLRRAAQVAPSSVPAAQITDAGRKQFRANLERIADVVQQSGASLVVCTQCMAAHEGASGKVRSFVSPTEAVAQQMIELAQWLQKELKSIAMYRQALFVDVYAEMPPDDRILADYIHFTAEGEQQLASLLANRIAELLP